MKLSESLKSKWIETNQHNEATGHKGWCSVFAEMPIYEGLYYCEVSVIDPKVPFPFEGVHPHVRIGIGQKDSNVELPIGAEEMSYSYRDRDGSFMNNRKAEPYGDRYTTGDIIGILVYLQPPKPKIKPKIIQDKPSQSEEVKDKSLVEDPSVSDNCDRDMDSKESIKTNINSSYDANSFQNPSFVYFFKNGVNQGIAIRNMAESFYFVGASLYMNARVRFNFGPDFKFPPDLTKEGIMLDEDIFLKPYDQISKEPIPYNDIV